MSATFEVEQAIRRGHCERKGSEHPCVGTLTVSPTGIVLSCPLCGTGDGEAIYGRPGGKYVTEKARELAQRFARRMGIAWESLSIEAQVGAAELAQEVIEAAP